MGDLNELVERLRVAVADRDAAPWDYDEELTETYREAAAALTSLMAERDGLPQFEGIAKRKLDDLLTRGWQVSGYAIFLNGEHGLVTTGGFVGWWTAAHNNATAAERRALAAEAQLKAAREALDWYADRVGLAGAMTEEGAKARAELTQDNGTRALSLDTNKGDGDW